MLTAVTLSDMRRRSACTRPVPWDVRKVAARPSMACVPAAGAVAALGLPVNMAVVLFC